MSTISREAAEAARQEIYCSGRRSLSSSPPITKRLGFHTQQAIDRATAALREENASMRTMLAHGAQELRKSLEAYKERDELRAECERLRQQLNSANQQHQL